MQTLNPLPILRKHYQEKGFCVLKNVLSESDCARVIERMESMNRDENLRFLPRMNPDRDFAMFRGLLCHPEIVESMESILNSPVEALQSLMYFKPPGQLGRDVHQDNHYVQTHKGALIGTWLSLDAADIENGCLFVYPGSHQEDVLEIEVDKDRRETNAGGFVNERGQSCRIPSQYVQENVITERGDVVLMDGNLIHGSGDNRSETRFRRAFVGHYIKKGFPFIAGGHAKRMRIDVHDPANLTWKSEVSA